MMITDYQNQADLLFKEYVLAGPFLPCAAVICGVLACKMVYDLSHVISTPLFKGYSALSRMQQVEWNNRAISTLHAVLITTVSLYLIFCSDLFAEDTKQVLIYQHSSLSSFILGLSAGYFLSDIGMIFWFYPSLGGMEYVLHHLLSMSALVYTMLTGLGQVYAYMVLLSEATTPSINLRWYLDVAGLKRSKAYVVNGVVIFFTWLVARIILFLCTVYHVYLHFDQVLLLPSFGLFLVLIGPVILGSLNLMWFGRITRGMLKTLAKSH